MSQSRRLSQSLTGSWKESSFVVPPFINPADGDVEEWVATWKTVFARDLIDSRIVAVDADTSVEDACDLLLKEDIQCLAVRARQPKTGNPYHGLFDYSDVNAFLTLAATRHTFLPDDLRGNPRVDDIVAAAKAGRVPVHLVSTLIQSSVNPEEFVGMVSDRRLLSWFDSYARDTPSFKRYLSNPIQSLSLPSLKLNTAVVAASSSGTILDAMKLMSEQGVSSVAVVDENSGTLLSAVSVTDIGKMVVPSQSNQILAMPLHYFVAQIKMVPWMALINIQLLSYTIEKLLATNAHRVFVTKESGLASPLASPILSPTFKGNLTGISSPFLHDRRSTERRPNPDATSPPRILRVVPTFRQGSLHEIQIEQQDQHPTQPKRHSFKPLWVRGSRQSAEFCLNPYHHRTLTLNRSTSRRSVNIKKDSIG
ncbi:hypothetical protein BDZ97DRAFT_1917442 [Flammula alnicola]|nr:hypothetical protein BDZ97DRAFT_1917442 [Flammula alnicola]